MVEIKGITLGEVKESPFVGPLYWIADYREPCMFHNHDKAQDIYVFTNFDRTKLEVKTLENVFSYPRDYSSLLPRFFLGRNLHGELCIPNDDGIIILASEIDSQSKTLEYSPAKYFGKKFCRLYHNEVEIFSKYFVPFSLSLNLDLNKDDEVWVGIGWFTPLLRMSTAEELHWALTEYWPGLCSDHFQIEGNKIIIHIKGDHKISIVCSHLRFSWSVDGNQEQFVTSVFDIVGILNDLSNHN